MNGVIVVDKPKGVTSHDVVASVKRKLRASKVGHLGTLDPNATGVLPLVINKSTKLATYFGGTHKAYTATMKLGEETDTYDVEGKVTKSFSIDNVTDDDIRRALDSFVGQIDQVPPMYSAVKRKGTPLYKLARKGVVVEREPKQIEIYAIEVVDIALPYVIFNVQCSRGTYIRTLCHDVGTVLSCGGHLSDLRRTLSGVFTIDEAISLDADLDTTRGALMDEEAVLSRLYKGIELSAVDADKVARGAAMLGLSDSSSIGEAEIVRLTKSGILVALAQNGSDGIFKVLKRFDRSAGGESQRLRANSRGI
ncbi:MAG: tRNA pseudouridine(55) synthase TruB [Proteobacteria bacterium]|nr:tRNA pseudouridine(55) synthase TruB [Pseudomonadota bacterium]